MTMDGLARTLLFAIITMLETAAKASATIFFAARNNTDRAGDCRQTLVRQHFLLRAMKPIMPGTVASSESMAGVGPITTMAMIARNISSVVGIAFAQSGTGAIVTDFNRLAVPTRLDILTY